MAKHRHKKVKKYPIRSLLPLMTAPEKVFYNGKEITCRPLILFNEIKQAQSPQKQVL